MAKCSFLWKRVTKIHTYVKTLKKCYFWLNLSQVLKIKASLLYNSLLKLAVWFFSKFSKIAEKEKIVQQVLRDRYEEKKAQFSMPRWVK